jgi:hypothetical protein
MNIYKPNPKKYRSWYSQLFPAKTTSPLKNESPIYDEDELCSEQPINIIKPIIPENNLYDNFKETVYKHISIDSMSDCGVILYLYDTNLIKKYYTDLNEIILTELYKYKYIGILNNKTNIIETYETAEDFIRNYWMYTYSSEI